MNTHPHSTRVKPCGLHDDTVNVWMDFRGESSRRLARLEARDRLPKPDVCEEQTSVSTVSRHPPSPPGFRRLDSVDRKTKTDFSGKQVVVGERTVFGIQGASGEPARDMSTCHHCGEMFSEWDRYTDAGCSTRVGFRGQRCRSSDFPLGWKRLVQPTETRSGRDGAGGQVGHRTWHLDTEGN